MNVDTRLIWTHCKCIIKHSPMSLTLLFSYEGRGRTTSITSVSVFGDDHRHHRPDPAAFNPSRFRPVSIISMQSDVSARDDDTMVSMIGGGGNARVRRKSVGSTLMLDASPCFRAEKRAKQLANSQFMDSSELESVDASGSTSFLQAGQSESQEPSTDFFSSSIDNSPSKGRSQAPPRPFVCPHPPAFKAIVQDSDSEEAGPSIGTSRSRCEFVTIQTPH
jgi:hypothetical protein